MVFSRLRVLNAFLTYFQLTMGLVGVNPIVGQGTSVYNHYAYSSHENFIGPLFQDKQESLPEVILKVPGYLKVISSQCVVFSVWMTWLALLLRNGNLISFRAPLGTLSSYC